MNDEYDALKKALGGEDRYDAMGRIVHDFYYEGLDLIAPAGQIPENAMINQEAMFFAFIQWLETRSMDDIEMCKGLSLTQLVKLLNMHQYVEYRNGVFMRMKPKLPFGDVDIIYSPIETDASDILVTLRPKKG